MKNGASFWVVLLLVAAAGIGGLYWLTRDPAPSAPVATSPPAPAPPPPPPDAAPEPAIRYPLEESETRRRAPLPGLAQSDSYIEDELKRLLGRKAMAALIRPNDFARSFVATVDNLATPFGTPHRWPVKTASGRLLIEEGDGGAVISPQNAERYDAFVRLATSVNTGRVVGLYRQLYPLFQEAYEDLGYPGKYFNDRMVEVIDHLLAFEPRQAPVAVKRLVREGTDLPSNLYVYEDEELEKLTTGHKLLLRMGPAHAEALQQKLREVRPRIASQGSIAP